MAQSGNFIENVFHTLDKNPAQTAIGPLESAMDGVGLMRGASAPYKRAAVGAALGGGLFLLLRPPTTFDKNGKLRSDPSIPIWAPMVAGAAFFGLFV